MSMDIFLDMGMAIEFYGGTDFLGWNFFFLTWKNFVGKFFIEWDFFVGMGFFFS